MKTMNIVGVGLALATRTVYSDHAGSAASGNDVPPATDDKSNIVLGVTIAFWLLALLVVALRVYTRTFLSKFRGQDDWWMVVATIFAAGDQAIKIIWCMNGLGNHIQDVSASQFEIFAKCGFAISVHYPWSLGLVKISILTFYLRLFPHDTFRKCCYAMMAVVACITISASFGQLFSCSPISNSWNLAPVPGHCINKAAVQYAGSALNLATDIIILLMPMKYLVKLSQRNHNNRYGIVVLFSLGLVSCAASALRLKTIQAFYTGTDPTWDATDIAIWSCLEINLTIITASIPALKPFFVTYLIKPTQSVLERSGLSSGRHGNSKTGGGSDVSSGVTAMADVAPNHLSGSDSFRKNNLDAWMDDDDEEAHGGGQMDFVSMLRSERVKEAERDIEAAHSPPNGREDNAPGHYGQSSADRSEFITSQRL